MSSKRKPPSGDPRKAGGSIAGPGGPRDKDAVVIDTTNAVLLEGVNLTMVEPYRDGQPASPVIALLLSGRINKTTEQTDILYLVNEDGAAALVSEMLALGTRIGPEFSDRLFARVAELTNDDAIGTVG